MVIVCQLISHCTSAWVVASKAAINISIYSTLFSCEDAKNSALPVAWFSRTYSVMPGRGKKNKKEEKGKKRELRGAASSVTKHKRTYCSRSVWKRNSIHVKWTFTLETPLGMNTLSKLAVPGHHSSSQPQWAPTSYPNLCCAFGCRRVLAFPTKNKLCVTFVLVKQ